jgi:26S proteasome non-ATPase regulatory subunit 10
MHSRLSGVVSAGQEDVVRELVGAGADVKRTNDKGLTPLCVSRRLGVEHR